MSLTLLLDLDDTLLSNDIYTFLPVYLKKLGKHLNDFVAPDQMVSKLLAATQAMVEKNLPALTLEQTFDQAFYPAIGCAKEELAGPLAYFYDTIFPTLQSLTQPRPEALELIRWAQANGHTPIIATNPVFPRTAILHRLRWANLDPEKHPFGLITDFEHFHFSKPNPAYYAEILAQLSWPDQPAVMVGNSMEEDLIPAAQLGLPVYWVNGQKANLPENLPPFSSAGPLADVPQWVESIGASDVAPNFSPAAVLAFLKSTPAALDTFRKSLPESLWQTRPEIDEWSVGEIFCHLRDADREVNLPRLDKLLAEDNPFLPGINTDHWAEERRYIQQDGQAALQEFIAVRTELIHRLENLSAADWQQPARHAIFGPTNLMELLNFTITHDRSHVQQVHDAIGVLTGNFPKNSQTV